MGFRYSPFGVGGKSRLVVGNRLWFRRGEEVGDQVVGGRVGVWGEKMGVLWQPRGNMANPVREFIAA